MYAGGDTTGGIPFGGGVAGRRPGPYICHEANTSPPYFKQLSEL